MEELATVIAIEDDYITVVSQVKSSCNSCSQLDSCASGQIAKAIPHRKLSFTIPFTQEMPQVSKNIKIGDCVVLTLPEIDVLKSAWQVYLLPILGLFLFSGLGQWLRLQGVFSHELIALLLCIFGGYSGYRVAKHLQNKPNQRNKLQPKIACVLPKDDDVTKVKVISSKRV